MIFLETNFNFVFQENILLELHDRTRLNEEADVEMDPTLHDADPILMIHPNYTDDLWRIFKAQEILLIRYILLSKYKPVSVTPFFLKP